MRKYQIAFTHKIFALSKSRSASLCLRILCVGILSTSCANQEQEPTKSDASSESATAGPLKSLACDCEKLISLTDYTSSAAQRTNACTYKSSTAKAPSELSIPVKQATNESIYNSEIVELGQRYEIDHSKEHLVAAGGKTFVGIGSNYAGEDYQITVLYLSSSQKLATAIEPLNRPTSINEGADTLTLPAYLTALRNAIPQSCR